MIIIDGENITEPILGAVVTSGTFDGVHFGHRKILKRVVKLAQDSGGHSAVITFWPHPRFVLRPDDDSLKLLSTFEEKATLFEKAGIDYLVKIPFTKEFSQLSSEQFIKRILIDAIGVKKLVIGYDHKFGRNREGSFDYLKEHSEDFGFHVEEISRQDVDHIGVSSTKIRKALLDGDVAVAAGYLSRAYELSGTVVHGKKLGTDIGFPTANLNIDEQYKLIPKDGVYAVKVTVNDQELSGMLNIGVRPTVDGINRVVEVHIFDFSEDIYGKKITLHFINRLRSEQKFQGIEELKGQLKKDKIEALKYV